MPPQVSTADVLDPDVRREVRALAEATQQQVGQPPLSDQALTHLSATGARHLLVHDGGRLTGYAQLYDTSLEIAGDTHAVSALLHALEPLPPGTQTWSHGTRSPLRAALERHGYRPVRKLHQLRRPLQPLPAEQPLPPGVVVRSFVPGTDEQAWLAVNAAAFARFADQGSWTSADLLAREREPWFDPDGFLLADRDGTLLGFHWTKVHTADLGEVYILGISPDAQGLGLGAALLQRGLAYLAGRGCATVLLYVDEDNAGAMHLYERSGFRRYDLDILWAAPAPGAA
jgi:mycothiol synthase